MKKFTIYCIGFSMIGFIYSCKKNIDEEVIPSSIKPAVLIDSLATYKITITGIWQTPQLAVPAGNHFTKFIGMIHDNGTAIFKIGEPATLGVENVAEVGNSTELIKEINSKIATGKASGSFIVTLPNIMGTGTAILNVSAKHALISFESMIAPTPDWFVGLESYNLIQNGNWVNDVTVNAVGYDAGTEEGDVFGYNNPPTSPQQNISFLTPVNASVIANGNPTVGAFVTVRFVKQ